jgi:hypothetical protein
VRLHGEDRKDFCVQVVKTLFARKPSSPDVKVKRANEYATPMHSARITKVYSVSFPVWIVSSQLSNVSRRGQIRQVSKTTRAVIRDARDHMSLSIAQLIPRAATKSEVKIPEDLVVVQFEIHRDGA